MRVTFVQVSNGSKEVQQHGVSGYRAAPMEGMSSEKSLRQVYSQCVEEAATARVVGAV